jgi:hypothetical protein
MANQIPQWRDEAGILRLVKEELAAAKVEDERLFQERFGFTIPGVSIEFEKSMEEDDIEDFAERSAVAAAKTGNIKPLVALLEPIREPMPGMADEVSDSIRRLSPDTWALVAEFLSGKRSLKNGRLKGEAGRPKMTEENRREQFKVNAAGDMYPAIQEILARHYPDVSKKLRTERAAKLAEKLAGTKSSVRLHLYKMRRAARRRA